MNVTYAQLTCGFIFGLSVVGAVLLMLGGPV